MDADEAAGSSRRMDLNLYLGLPRAPRPRRSDLGSDLALSTPMPSSPSSSAASVDAPPPPPELSHHPPYSPSHADLSPPPPEVYSLYNPEDPPAPEGHLPYVPPPAPVISELPDDLEFGLQPPPPLVRASELLGWEDRPSSSTASSSFLPDAAARYWRLLEQTGNRWLRARRFRSDLPPLSSEAYPAGRDAAVPVPQHEVPNDAVQHNKVGGDGTELGASDESEEQGRSAATFECNICFDMASEPVVTSCGHLFCWPCLYQWLNVYSNHKECPVCKGEVTEANITPIYGRGNSCLDAEKSVEDGKQTGPAIPPRPHGNRLESFRQQFHHLRPISRRLGEAHGLLSSWRRLLDQQIMNTASRFEGPSESAVQEIVDTAHAQHTSRLSRLASRMRARRLQREADSPNPPDGGGSIAPDSGLIRNNASDPSRNSPSSLLPDGIDWLRGLTLLGYEDTERFANAMSDFRRITGPSQYGASTSSSNPPNPASTFDRTHVVAAPSADQASNSSTAAVIQGDAGISESGGEPSNAGSSRSLRRRGRSSGLGSLDTDGGGLQRNKRRRIN
uniref:E3 ubiquitin-protein ligase RMA n=1 Tax=Leersia perrieri TaxID=77586 RepID=A0A0D9V7E2_9ORYZ